MKRKSANTEKLPKDTPKGKPKRAPKRAPKVAPEIVPNPEPKQPPKVRPIRPPRPAPIMAPVVAPESYSISFYSLPNWDNDHSTSPHSYGNRGMALYQSHTEADGKAWLRDNEYYGHFAAVERINGKIGKSWHIEIEPLEEETSGDDLSLLDPDDIDLDDADLINPAIVRAKIENAKLRAQLEARNGHGGLGELIEGIKFVEEIKKQAGPQKSLAEQIREAKEIAEIVTPRREANPAPAPAPQVDPKIEALKLIAESPNTAEIVKEVFFGSKGESERDPWAEVAMEAVKSGQLGPIVQAAINGLGNLFANLLPKPAPTPAPVQTPQAAAPQQTQPAPQVAPQASQPALPQADQPQATQAQALSPQDDFLYTLVSACEQNAPIGEVQNFINLSLIRNPELEDSLDQLLNLPIDQLLGLAVSIHPPLAQAAHAKTWLESLVAALTAEGGEEFTEREIDS